MFEELRCTGRTGRTNLRRLRGPRCEKGLLGGNDYLLLLSCSVKDAAGYLDTTKVGCTFVQSTCDTACRNGNPVPEACVLVSGHGGNCMSAELEGKKIAILATDGFEQSELMEPRRALKQAGAETFVVSIESGEITGWNHKDWGESVEVDRTLDRVKPADFDALVLPGGVLNPDQLRMNQKAVNFVREFVASGKPVAAICHGPWMLVETGAVKGKTITSWPSLKTDITNAGGNWVDQEVARDGQFITSRNPSDIPAFNKALIDLIGKSGQQQAAA